ncbi:MAG: hypothetical protein A3F72_03725 [Bacteroidetes bacterium RIFCSPLOWO2_12_FULL_35_15]|nr:MAG: hypothetical protein A3F72_03725 [Bacteroidetes bacterium RIFCSPLOWO2_12_FULL_35_15]
MLSEIVKKKIEVKAGIRVRYSRDCEILAEKIYEECKCKLSASTLRRLFGFVNGTKVVRGHTLDVISNYLGYQTWDDLIQPLDKSSKLKSKQITELKTSNLKQGDKYQYFYKPEAEVIIEYIGKSTFRVISAKQSQLRAKDVFRANILTLHHPIFILEVEREGESLEKIIEAKVSGITSIKKL